MTLGWGILLAYWAVAAYNFTAFLVPTAEEKADFNKDAPWADSSPRMQAWVRICTGALVSATWPAWAVWYVVSGLKKDSK